jgi:23S rRNA (cytosine1962-C5)-methyltransferase
LVDDRYELIDFGDGRKLESLAGRLIDRPAPAAAGLSKASPDRWRRAESYFGGENRSWSHRTPWPGDFSLDCGHFRMPVRPTPFGHIGLFPEQAANWDWLARPPASAAEPVLGLNLFGYTGASTMAMVAAGLHAVHVDAAKPNVQAARLAARLNGWQQRPIRYLVDDARKFAARELRRRRKYHTIVLDPPEYGHGSSGDAWRLVRDLGPLLDDCLRLLANDAFRLVVTGHSRNIDQADVLKLLQRSDLIRRHRDSSALRTEAGRSQLRDTHGRSLDAGFFVRIERQPSN